MSTPTVHAVLYQATTPGGLNTERGVALVTTTYPGRPSWAQVAEVVPGFVTGTYLGLASERDES